MRKVTPEEVEKLYVFTRQHYVEYYDLQTELVDHLANAIEERWEENSSLKFQENLQIEFKKFGVFGFMDIVEKRQRAMGKRYQKLLWKETKEILTKPLVLSICIVLAAIFTLILKLPQGYAIMMGIFCALTPAYITLLLIRRYRKKKGSLPEKKYLLESIIMQNEQAFGLFALPFYIFQFLNHTDFVFLHTWFAVLLGPAVSLLMVMMYCISVEIPKKKEIILRKVYPARRLM